MEVHLSPEKQAQFAKVASEQGANPEELAEKVLGEFLSQHARFVEAVRAGEAALDRGEYLTHAEVGARIDLLLRS